MNVAALLNVIGVLVYGACLTSGEPLVLPNEEPGMTYSVSWSYTICAVAALCSSFAGVCLIVEYINNKSVRYSRRSRSTGINNPVHQQHANNGRLDNSFSPYTSFPDLENVETNSSTAAPAAAGARNDGDIDTSAQQRTVTLDAGDVNASVT